MVDLNQSVGPPFLGTRDIYLWLECVAFFGGLTEAEMDLGGTLEVVGFTGLNGVTNTGALPTLQLTFPGCFSAAPLLVGVVTLRDSTGAGGRVCFSGTNVSRDCTGPPPADHPNGWTGYATDGLGEPCRLDQCAVDITFPESWARVKAQYRR
jgi:hypothetical protein